MFEYLLMFFGINLDSKFFANLFTGLTLSIFPALLFRYSLIIKLEDDFSLLSSKILCVTILFNLFISYLTVKLKSKEILRLNDELKNTRLYLFEKKLNTYYPTFVAVSVWLILITNALLLHLIENRLRSNFGHLLIEQNLMSIAESLSTSSLILYCQLWRMSQNLIYHELNTQYSIIIRYFNIELKKKISFSDINSILVTHRIVLRFIELQTNLEKIVNSMKYFISLDIISVALYFSILLVSSLENSECILFYLSSIIYVSVLFNYSLWVLYEVKEIKTDEKVLEQNLNHLLSQETNELNLVELQVLQRTVRQLVSGAR